MHVIDEPVHLVEYDQNWPKIYAAEQARLAAALAIPFQRIKHIGSTAVPELAAKPIIDIMVGSTDWPPAEVIGTTISHLGYESLGEAGVPERLYFRFRGATDFNLHVVHFDGNHWRANIALRDYLRRHKEARIRYAQAKRAAVSSGAMTLLAYSDAKSPAIASLLAEALAPQNRRQ